jgi:maltose alpha-D-glucosyltransferase/alpha-amylase
MLDNDRRRLELAFSLLLTLPGTPMLQFGDEIGLGDDLSLPERESARTPMQWNDDAHGGFTTARRAVRPVIDDPIYGYRSVNVAAQRRDPGSLLTWISRALRVRKECVEIGWGDWKLLAPGTNGVLLMRYDWLDQSFVAAHNFTRRPAVAVVGAREAGGRLVSLLSTRDSTPDASGRHVIELEPYGYRWYKVGGTDKPLPPGRSQVDPRRG